MNFELKYNFLEIIIAIRYEKKYLLISRFHFQKYCTFQIKAVYFKCPFFLFYKIESKKMLLIVN